MKKDESSHRMGKETGYQVINGVYHIAPLYWEQFEKINNDITGIKNMLDMVTTHAQKDLSELQRQQNLIFKKLSEDIGLDISKQWVYSNGTIKEIPAKGVNENGNI